MVCRHGREPRCGQADRGSQARVERAGGAGELLRVSRPGAHAALATLFNPDVQAVVIYEGFPFKSRLNFPHMADFLSRQLSVDPDAIEPAEYGTALAGSLRRARPELDLYLLTDHAPERLASSP